MEERYNKMKTDPIEDLVIQSRLEKIKRARENPDIEVIEIELSSVEQVYNHMDPSPFYDKELDANAEQYLLSALDEIPLKKEAMLVIYVQTKKLTEKKETILKDSIHRHFERKAKSLDRQAHKKTKRVTYSAIFGIIFLGLCLTISYKLTTQTSPESYYQILGQGLVVIGWVALWDPTEYFLFDWWEPRKEIAECKKISKIAIEVIPVNPPDIEKQAKQDDRKIKSGDIKVKTDDAKVKTEESKNISEEIKNVSDDVKQETDEMNSTGQNQN
ncbi:hypothetical protein MsAg5_11520 [Methanosarcinaceae archaeon Ag5]|uniref:Uncharacterized protein n=1 Tax=Methanolapillus africanus TaxID=3028297 RepID=A0AAE4MKH4_9EURY|nr:hypothetical protein [Methanosarcinaceae archaeon Ag5]